MATTRDQLQATLAVHDADALRLILRASDVDPRDARTPAELAARVADAIWWNYCTPLGYVAERSTLEDIVRHLARKLGVADRVDPDVPVWEQMRALTVSLVPDPSVADGITLHTLDDTARARLGPSWAAALGWGGGASSSLAARWGASKALALLKTPIGRLLPLLPVVGPWVGMIRAGIGGVHLVTGPLGIAMTVLSLNSALGTNYQRLVPLILGVGALGPDGVQDAHVVTEPAPTATPAPTAAEPTAAEPTAATEPDVAPAPMLADEVELAAADDDVSLEEVPAPLDEGVPPLDDDALADLVTPTEDGEPWETGPEPLDAEPLDVEPLDVEPLDGDDFGPNEA